MNLFFGKISSLNIFMAFSITLLCASIYATYNPEQKHKVLLQIDVDQKDLTSLDEARHTKLSTTQFYESINFPSNSVLRHVSGRPVGFNKNFFISVRSEFEVINGDLFDISVSSDDGYRLFIDDKIIGEFTSNRPANNDKFQLFLNRGKHKLTMDYYQGFGNAALQVQYKPSNTDNFIFYGVDSEYIKFTPFS